MVIDWSKVALAVPEVLMVILLIYLVLELAKLNHASAKAIMEEWRTHLTKQEATWQTLMAAQENKFLEQGNKFLEQEKRFLDYITETRIEQARVIDSITKELPESRTEQANILAALVTELSNSRTEQAKIMTGVSKELREASRQLAMLSMKVPEISGKSSHGD